MFAFLKKSNGENGGRTRLGKCAEFGSGFAKLLFAVGVIFTINAATWSANAGELILPAPGMTNCATKPSVCGYPDATNTGPLKGTVFKRVPQDITRGLGWRYEPEFKRVHAYAANAIIENIETHVPIVIDEPNVVVRNNKVYVCDEFAVVWIRAGRPKDGYNGDYAKIYRNLLGCDGRPDQRAGKGISDTYGTAKGLRAWRNNIFNVENGITIEIEGVVRGNYIHDLGHLPGDHHSGLSTHGGATRVVFDFNTVITSQEAVSAAITVYSGYAKAQNVTVTRNLLSGGSYCFYGGDSGDYAPAAGSVLFKYNRLSRLARPNCGEYGAIAFYSPIPGEIEGNVWDENLKPVR